MKARNIIIFILVCIALFFYVNFFYAMRRCRKHFLCWSSLLWGCLSTFGFKKKILNILESPLPLCSQKGLIIKVILTSVRHKVAGDSWVCERLGIRNQGYELRNSFLRLRLQIRIWAKFETLSKWEAQSKKKSSQYMVLLQRILWLCIIL